VKGNDLDQFPKRQGGDHPATVVDAVRGTN
jgi:hypothetical protein